jgi:hypothetical protein
MLDLPAAKLAFAQHQRVCFNQTCAIRTNNAGKGAEWANFLVAGIALEVAHEHTVKLVRFL